MNITVPQERISQDLYKTLTPIKRKTFSENMIKRRTPFLNSDNKENVTFITNLHLRSKQKQNSQNNKTPLASTNNRINGNKTDTNTEYNNDLETENWLKLKSDIMKIKSKHKLSSKTKEKQITENKTNKQNQIETYENETSKENNENLSNTPFKNEGKSEKHTQNSSDITPSSDYYSNNSITDSLVNETSLENSFNAIKPLTNSTFICKAETQENGTNTYETANNISLETNEKECSETNRNNETFIKQNKIETSLCKKYPLYKPENFQIPLIIINEIEIIDYNKKPQNICIIPLKTLKVPIIPRRSSYEENRDLQKKLTEKELYKQIEIKDKVMQHLLEIALCLEFPKLKHYCGKECERTAEGLCKKQLKLEQNKLKKDQEETKGFFKTIWGAIKYPFVVNVNHKEKEVIKKEGSKETKELDKENIEEGDFKDNKLNEIKYELEKEENKGENVKEIKKLEKEKVEQKEPKDKERKGNEKEQPEIVKSIKDDVKDSEITDLTIEKETKTDLIQRIDQELEQKASHNENNKLTTEMEPKERESLVNTELKETETLTENKVQQAVHNLEVNLAIKHNINNLETKTEIDSKELKETDNNNTINIETKDLPEAFKKEEKSESNLALLTDQRNANSSKEIDNSSTKSISKEEASNKNLSPENKKKPKTKKRFLFFFHKTEKTKIEENKMENNEDLNKIENMEDIMDELEKAEKTISQEALKKLESFMAEKQFSQNERKTRTKRSDSF